MLKQWLKKWLGITALEEQVCYMPPAAKQTSAVIDDWILEREKHLPGSPKHIAFTNRLTSLGVKCGD